MARFGYALPTSFMVTAPLQMSISSSALYTTWVSLPCSAFSEKKSTRDMGMPDSTFLSELIEGLTLFFSIIEMVLLVTPARLARSRWDRPFCLRMACSRAPTSDGEFLERNAGWKVSDSRRNSVRNWQGVIPRLAHTVPDGETVTPRRSRAGAFGCCVPVRA